MRCGFALLVMFSLVCPAAWCRGENWNAWRGPRGDGTSSEKGVPTRWDAASGSNILWRVRLPGVGHASPIVWQDRIFIATCLPDSGDRVLLCLDTNTGKSLWQQTVITSKLETKHALNSHASSTPATDGQWVFVTFLQIDGHTIPAPNVSNVRPVTPGQIVVAAYDFAGQQRWKSIVGEFVSAHGFCSCPVLYQDLVIINGDHDGDSYIVALDRATGQVRWRTPRQNRTRSYATPIIRQVAGRTQMVLSGDKSVFSYDPQTGTPYWHLDGPTEQFVASMVFDGQLFFVTAGYPDHHILAIRPDGDGNVTDSHIVWRTERGAAYVPSPVVVDKYLLVVSDAGIASCFDCASGKRYWMERLGSGYSASLVAADGLAYFLADNGATTVVRPGEQFDRRAENALGQPCSASPAISGGRIYLRGEHDLFCIGP